MNKQEKQAVIELLKQKFSTYDNFYITNTDALNVVQTNALRRVCFERKVEMIVAKNTLITKALEQLNKEKYEGVYASLHNVTALLFSENAKEPALIISSFREEKNTDKPVLKAAFVGGGIFVGNDQLSALKSLKSKNELLGEIIGLLQSPSKNVVSGLVGSGQKIANLLKTLEEKAQG